MYSPHKVVQLRLTYITHMRGITHCLTEWALKFTFMSSVPILLYHSRWPEFIFRLELEYNEKSKLCYLIQSL